MRILFENINAEGPAFDLESCEGRMVNSGHGLESMWFMLQHAEAKSDTALIAPAADIIKVILDFGTDRKYEGGKWKTMFHLARCLFTCAAQLEKLC